MLNKQGKLHPLVVQRKQMHQLCLEIQTGSWAVGCKCIVLIADLL